MLDALRSAIEPVDAVDNGSLGADLRQYLREMTERMSASRRRRPAAPDRGRLLRPVDPDLARRLGPAPSGSPARHHPARRRSRRAARRHRRRPPPRRADRAVRVPAAADRRPDRRHGRGAAAGVGAAGRVRIGPRGPGTGSGRRATGAVHGRLRRHRLPRVRAQPRRPHRHRRPHRGDLAGRAHARSSSPEPGAPTPASTPGGRWSRSTCRSAPTSTTCRAASTSCARPTSRCAKRTGPTPTSTPASRRRGASTATTSGTTRPRTRSSPAPRWHVAQPLDLVLMQAGVSPLIGEHDFASFCRKPKVPEGQAPRQPGADPARDHLGAGRRLAAAAHAHPGERLLPPDGAVDLRHARRRRPAQAHTRRRERRRSAPTTAPRPGQIAPPQGLVLWEVGYDGERWDRRHGPGEPSRSPDPL